MKPRRTSIPDDLASHALAPLRTAGVAQPAPVDLGFSRAKGQEWVATLHHEIEGVHFDPTFLSPYDLGRKCVNTVLFQLASNGIQARTIQITAGVNQSTTEPFLDEVFRGVKTSSDAHKVAVQYGNSAHSPTSFFLSTLAFGKRRGAAAKASVGDCVAVTGTLGTANAGLQCLRKFGWPAVKDHAQVVRAHLCPEPPLAACLGVDLTKISGMTALVDGLSSDLYRLSRQSGTGFQIDESLLPILPQARDAAGFIGASVRQWALFGAEDFGLMITVPQKHWKKVSESFRKAGTSLTQIGEARPKDFGIQMKNLEGEEIRLAESSWNPLVRKKTR